MRAFLVRGTDSRLNFSARSLVILTVAWLLGLSATLSAAETPRDKRTTRDGELGTVIVPDGDDTRGSDPGGGDPGGDPGGGDPGGADPGGGDDGRDDDSDDGTVTPFACTGPLAVNEVMSDNNAGVPGVENIDGQPSDWFEIHNLSTTTVNVADFRFSDGSTVWIPAALSLNLPLPPGQQMVIYASKRDEVIGGAVPEWHTNFKLSNGETVSILDSGTNTVDSLTIPTDLRVNDSFGLMVDGDCDNPRYFDDADRAVNSAYGPTPGGANAASILPFNYAGYTPDPVITPSSSMAATGAGEATAASGATVHVELDGSTPIIGTSPSALELFPFNIVGCISARAQATLPDHIRSHVVSATYVNNGRDHTLPVFLLTGDPTDLDVGPGSLYQATPDVDDERPIQVDVLDGGAVVFSQNAGLQINAPGGASSSLPQRPLRLNARSEYGPNRFEHAFFSSKDASSFKSLVLKNGGTSAFSNDWSQTMFQEPLAHQLVIGEPADIAVDYQAYEPVIVYLNCGYYGIHNLREKINHHYPGSNYGVDDDEVNLYKPSLFNLRHGNDTFPAIRAAIEATLPADLWGYLQTPASGIDYNEFISYQVIERFLGNNDWPFTNNQATWQQDPDGLFRWILYDLDGGFTPGFNVHLTNATGFISELVPSEEVFADFVQHLAARMSVTFRPERALPVIDAMHDAIEAEIANPADESDPLYHVGRWASAGGISSLAAWEADVQDLRDYFLGRSQAVYNLLEGGSGAFGVADGFDLTFERVGQGDVRAQRVPIPAFPFDGRFFTEQPLALEAIPAPGYLFEGWYLGSVGASNLLSNDSPYAYPSPAGNVTIVANFLPDPSGSTDVLFSEIHYNSAPSFDTGDWVELFNNTAQFINLSGWEFRDDDDTHIYTLPAGTVLPAFDMLILCRDQAAFEAAINPNWPANTCLDWGAFGLSSADAVRLFDSTGALVQSVNYDAMTPWPTQPNEGDSLQFLPLSGSWPATEANGDPAHWFYPVINTPGWIFH